MKEVFLEGEKFQLFGRIDLSKKNAPMLVWPGSYVRFRFSGSVLSAQIENLRYGNGRYIGVVIDGSESCIELGDGITEVKIAEGLEPGDHDAVIFKRMAGHYFRINKLYLSDEGEISEPPQLPQKRIEFYGDSVTAGDLVDYDDRTGDWDPPQNDGSRDNSWHTYASITARELPAQVFNTSQGGIAIFDNTGYFEMPNMRGEESCFDKLCYSAAMPVTEWDFSRFVPHVVVFAIGQNDSSVGNDKIYDPEYRERWKNKYAQIIKSVRSHSPDATVVLALTVMGHDNEWDNAIHEIKDMLGGEENKVYHLMYKRVGKATPGHPRNSEQREMADELMRFLNSLPESTWKD